MRWVDTPEELAAASLAFEGQSQFFIDTEFESSRSEKLLCLVQVSAGSDAWLIDALKLKNLSSLAKSLAKPGAEWILHAAQQDVELLLGALGLHEAPTLFDTQIAWALLSAEHSVSLAYLEYLLLGQRRTKGYQTDDWKRRPLPKPQLAYAAADIEHLPALHRELGRRATAANKTALIHAASHELVTTETESAAPLSLASFRNAWQLDPPHQAALKALIVWHNELDTAARAYAPDTKVLLAIASRLPETVDELLRIKGVPRSWQRRDAAQVLKRLEVAATTSNAADFEPIQPLPYATFEELRADAWLSWVRAELCAELNVAPELALPVRVLKKMRAALLGSGDTHSTLACLSGWREELLKSSLERWCRELPLRLSPAG